MALEFEDDCERAPGATWIPPWDNYTTNGGSCTITEASAMNGVCGAVGVGTGGSFDLGHDIAGNPASLWVAQRFKPVSCEYASNKWDRHSRIRTVGDYGLRFEFGKNTDGNLRFRVVHRDDLGTWTIEEMELEPSLGIEYFTEIFYKPATAVGADDGEIMVFIDGIMYYHDTGVDNDTTLITEYEQYAQTNEAVYVYHWDDLSLSTVDGRIYPPTYPMDILHNGFESKVPLITSGLEATGADIEFAILPPEPHQGVLSWEGDEITGLQMKKANSIGELAIASWETVDGTDVGLISSCMKFRVPELSDSFSLGSLALTTQQHPLIVPVLRDF